MNEGDRAGYQDEKLTIMIEEALNRALGSYFPSIASRTMTARAEFYDKYKREADEYDKDFIKKYDEDLNTTLIFAGLFSAVTSAFIIDFQQDLQEDFTETSAKLLRVLVQNANATAFGDHVDPPPVNWRLTDDSYVGIQCAMYASLAVSVLAACLAMLGKQWLNRYNQVEMRGTLIQRSRHRHRKMTGMAAWYFDVTMESLPVMLQIALLLFCYGLSRYLWNVNLTVAAVIIATTSLGFIFYFCIVLAATASYECPYQTPVSLLLRLLISYDVRKTEWYRQRTRILESFRGWAWDRSGSRISPVKTWFISDRKKSKDPEAPATHEPTDNAIGFARRTTSVSSFHSAISEWEAEPGPSAVTDNLALSELRRATTTKSVVIPASPTNVTQNRRNFSIVPIDPVPIPLFTKGDLDWEGFVLDSRLLDWMSNISTDTEIIITVLRFIPDIIWHSGVANLPSVNELYELILSSFDLTKKPRVLIQSFKGRALAAAKALIHLKIQRKCLTGEDISRGRDITKPDQRPRLASQAAVIPAEEGDLECALGVLDYIEGRADSVRWEAYKLSSAHHQWLAHILLYRCWDESRDELGIDEALSSFIKYSFNPERDPSSSVIADCLFMVCLQMGLPMHQDDLHILDKSRELGTVMERIYGRLGTILVPAPPDELPSIDNIRMLASTIELMKPLGARQSLDQLFDLFVVSRNLVLDGDIQDAEMKELNQATMGIARSALSAAWAHPTQTPSARSLPDSLKFLVTHFDLLLRGEAHYKTIEATLWSLGSAAAPKELSEDYFIPELDDEIEELAVSPVFVKGFCALFDPSVPPPTRKAALLVFPLLTQSWFGRWMESVSGPRSVTWEQRKVPVMGEQEMNQFCQNWDTSANQNPLDRESNAIILLSTLLWMMSSSHWLKYIPELQFQLLRYHARLPWDSPMLMAAFKCRTLITDLIALNKREGLKLWTTICWIHEQDIPQHQREQLEMVSKKHVGLADNKETFKAITEAQEMIQVELRQYELEPGNPVAKKLRARKEGMDRSKGRLRLVAPQLGAIA